MAESHPARIARVAFLEQQIEALIRLADQAGSADCNQPGAAVGAIGKANDLRRELDQHRAFEADLATVGRTPLEEARALRKRADAAGSHVAARDLFKVELELLDKEERRRLAEEQARLDHLDEEQLVTMLVEQLRAMPAVVVRRVLEQLAAPPTSSALH